MTAIEWFDSTDAPRMLQAIWDIYGVEKDNDITPRLHRYFVACCRRIWVLLPAEGSRRGVEVAERYLAIASSNRKLKERWRRKLYRVNYVVEGAAFNFSYDGDPETIAKWVAEVDAIPSRVLAALLNPPGISLDFNTRELLEQAAYFVDYATCYANSSSNPQVSNNRVSIKCSQFLSADLLREQLGNPLLLHDIAPPKLT